MSDAMKDPPTQQAPSELPTRAPEISEGSTRSALPEALFEAKGQPSAEVPAELRDHPRYRVLELLGQGGMGAVFKAEHRHMGRVVALKVIRPALVGSEGAIRRFHQEVHAAARLHHPNIVTAHDADQAGGLHFLVMEFLDGESLAEYARRKGVLPVAEACEYARQTALGLQHAHEQGMVHRDVKPHNLMRAPDGQVKILDFGLARLAQVQDVPAGPALPTSSQLTDAGAVMGTADYMAPEQAGNARTADIRADIYSLGCTLYQMLTGSVPFPEGTAIDKLVRHSADMPPDLARLRPGLPAGLTVIVRKMMAKDPSARFQTPAEVAGALAPFAAPRRGGRRLVTALAVLALALFIGLAASLWLGNPFGRLWSERQSAPAEPPATETGSVVAMPEKKSGKRRSPVRRTGVPVKYRDSINKGLAYLVKVQQKDGHWEGNGGQYLEALTAMAGMAMLMEGSTVSDGDYADSIRRAADWLMARSQTSGLIAPASRMDTGRYMFGHGYAMLFLATVYGQEEDDERRDKLEKILIKAVEFTSSAQTFRGGWGYVAAAQGSNFDEGASSIIQMQGLRAARNAGVVVPKRLFDIDYLRKSTNPRGGVIYSTTFAPKEGDPAFANSGRPALTAAALACMLTAGDYDSDLARKWITFCRQSIPLDKPAARIGHDEYTHYYLAQALYILGDKGYEKLFPGSKPAERLTWSKYRETTFDAFLASQDRDGSWTKNNWMAKSVGPVYVSACYLTVLQLDNDVLPIYRR